MPKAWREPQPAHVRPSAPNESFKLKTRAQDSGKAAPRRFWPKAGRPTPARPLQRCRSQLKISSEIRIDRKIDRIDLAFRQLHAALWPVGGAKCTAGTAPTGVRSWCALCGPVLPRERAVAGSEGPSFKAEFTLSSIFNNSPNLEIRKSATLTIPTSPR